ncbi:hypothetical protein QTP88_023512 [Uroleucon formosanum]
MVAAVFERALVWWEEVNQQQGSTAVSADDYKMYESMCASLLRTTLLQQYYLYYVDKMPRSLSFFVFKLRLRDSSTIPPGTKSHNKWSDLKCLIKTLTSV